MVYILKTIAHIDTYTHAHMRAHTHAYLILAAEDVSIVLLEPSHSRQARERTRNFVAVQDAKIRHSDRKLTVGP